MATQISKTAQEATDQVVELIEQAQEAATAVVANVSEAVSAYVPELGIGEVLMSPQEAVETAFKVTDRFIEAGRKSTLGFVAAIAPITDKVFGSSKPAPKAVAKSA